MGKRGPKPRAFKERYYRVYGDPDSCWHWREYKTTNGYGTFCHNGKTVRAHRYSYEQNFGPIPKGMFVLHKCHNPGCVNPDHLYLGDQKQNMRDCIRSGRIHSPVADAIKKYGGKGVTPRAVKRRVSRLGWSFEDAVRTPLLPTGVGRGQRQGG